MRVEKILHILRNPYGYGEKEQLEVRLAAADEIEKLIDAYQNMTDWAKSNGIDIMTNNPFKESDLIDLLDEMKIEVEAERRE